MSYPTAIVLNANGAEKKRIVGYDRKGPSIYVRNLASALNIED